MAWLEGSALGHAMRESGVWTYGVVNLLHILGVASLFGAVLVLDLRLIGLWRRVALAEISTPTVPIAATGFVIAAITGVCLLATKATEYVGNPFLYIKFPAIALGLLNVAALNSLKAWKQHRIRELSARERSTLAVFGGISLFCWLTAVTAGRMIGYW
jgi:membrane-bound ClpP family serine protease